MTNKDINNLFIFWRKSPICYNFK